MRYLKTGSDEFLQNGRSTVRLGVVLTMPSPVSKGRTVRVFEILQVLRDHPANPAPPRGALVALSFPNEKLHAKEYKWSGLEESFVPYEITDRKTNLAAMQRGRNGP